MGSDIGSVMAFIGAILFAFYAFKNIDKRTGLIIFSLFLISLIVFFAYIIYIESLPMEPIY
jgi:hypothetical protein